MSITFSDTSFWKLAFFSQIHGKTLKILTFFKHPYKILSCNKTIKDLFKIPFLNSKGKANLSTEKRKYEKSLFMWSQLSSEIWPDVVQILKKNSSMSYPWSSIPWIYLHVILIILSPLSLLNNHKYHYTVFLKFLISEVFSLL